MKPLLTAVIAIVISAACFYAGSEVHKEPEVMLNNYHNESIDELNQWQMMELAIIKTESTFDSLAVGKGECYGIIQIAPIYVKEVNRLIGEERYKHEDAFCPVKSLEMFDIMQAHHNPQMDIDKAISGHNPTATTAYSARVRRNIDWIRTYERYRKIVKKENHENQGQI